MLSTYFARRSAIGHGVSRAEIREMLLNFAEKKGFALAANVELGCSSKYITKLVKRTHTVPGAVALQGSVPKGLSIPCAKARELAVLDSFVTTLNGVFTTIKTKDGWETDAHPPGQRRRGWASVCACVPTQHHSLELQRGTYVSSHRRGRLWEEGVYPHPREEHRELHCGALLLR